MKSYENKTLLYSGGSSRVSVAGTFAQQAPNSVSFNIIATFDYPDQAQTIPEGINQRGDVTGIIIDSDGVSRGFVRYADGTFSPPIVEPHDTMGHTEGRGITNQQLVCGWYIGSDGFDHGYFLEGGVFSEFNVSGADNTIIDGLNEAGDFVGNYDYARGNIAFSNIAGVTTPIVIPGDVGNSFAYAINRSRQITGGFQMHHAIHGWWQDSDGTVYAPFDPPGSVETLPFGINDRGWAQEDTPGMERSRQGKDMAFFIVWQPGVSSSTIIRGPSLLPLAASTTPGSFADVTMMVPACCMDSLPKSLPMSEEIAREAPLAIGGSFRALTLTILVSFLAVTVFWGLALLAAAAMASCFRLAAPSRLTAY